MGAERPQGDIDPTADGAATRRDAAVPLVVDMDGTLLLGDSLHEGVLALLRQHPRACLALPVWLLGGRAGFKARIAERVELDAAYLPYNEHLLARLRAEAPHRRIVLCTAADERFARAVADHLGFFDEVIASADGRNMKAGEKARTLVARFGERGFDYAGNDTADLPVFAAAQQAWVVNPSAGLRARIGRVSNLEAQFPGHGGSRLQALVRALRMHQWVKNVLVFVPLLATLQSGTWETLLDALLAFVAFCLVCSSVYIVNDLLDLGADRRHPRKRLRPFASGALPITAGLKLLPVLVLLGFGTALLTGTWFAPLLALYYVSNWLYTFWLKRVPLLDAIILAGMYTLRILGGAAAIDVEPSFWLLAFSMFFFLSLAMAKRHSELVELEGMETGSAIPGREYRPEDLHTLIAQGSASGYSAVLVLALYINSADVQLQYRHPEIIWLICPLLLYWINKLWLNSQRREITEDPLIWAATNRVSRAVAVLCVALLVLAKLMP